MEKFFTGQTLNVNKMGRKGEAFGYNHRCIFSCHPSHEKLGSVHSDELLTNDHLCHKCKGHFVHVDSNGTGHALLPV